MGRIDNSIKAAHQVAQAVAPALKREVTSLTGNAAEVVMSHASDKFARLRPVAEKMMASAGQKYGANMASVARDLTLSPAERAQAFRARHQNSLAGRTGLVTGAAGNIGAETAFMMASNKMNVMLTDIPRANLDNIAETCEILGAPKVEISKQDLTTDEGREALIHHTLSSVGSPYASAMCAGIYMEGSLWHSDATTRQKQINQFRLVNKINVESPVLLAEGLVPHLEPGSHVLVVNSLAGEMGVKGEAAYCGSKFGLDGFWSTMAKDHADQGIKFEQVFPSALLGKMAEGREGLEAELLHFPLAIVRAIEAAFKVEGNSYLPRTRVSGTISPYAADHG